MGLPTKAFAVHQATVQMCVTTPQIFTQQTLGFEVTFYLLKV
jgi:hypothetical protein